MNFQNDSLTGAAGELFRPASSRQRSRLVLVLGAAEAENRIKNPRQENQAGGKSATLPKIPCESKDDYNGHYDIGNRDKEQQQPPLFLSGDLDKAV